MRSSRRPKKGSTRAKVGRLSIGGDGIPLDHPGLAEGWHDPEPDGRWTAGRALIPAALVGLGPVEIEIAATLVYPARAASS